MRRKLKLKAELIDGALESSVMRVHAEYENKSVTKIMEIEDFCAILMRRKVQKKVGGLSSGILPSGTFFYKMMEDGSYHVAIYTPGEIREINYRGEYILVPFPASVMYFHQNRLVLWRATTCKSQNLLTENTPLYHWPYGHVYDGGTVCVGNVRTASKKEKDIPKIIHALYSAENGHSNTSVVRLADNIDQVSGKNYKEFPKDLLIDCHETLGQFIKKGGSNS